MNDVCTVTLLQTKLLLDDDSGFRHDFWAKASLPLSQSASAVTHDTTRLCWIVVTLWDCHIHADSVRAFWHFNVPVTLWKLTAVHDIIDSSIKCLQTLNPNCFNIKPS